MRYRIFKQDLVGFVLLGEGKSDRNVFFKLDLVIISMSERNLSSEYSRET
jgi:hypothetical protein